MFCPFCGHQNRDGKKFCRQCGRTMPSPRANVGTTPLPHYNNFTEEPATANAEASFPVSNQTSPQSQTPTSNQLIDQSIYSNFSPSVDRFDKVSKSSPGINPQWQPQIETESEEDYVQEEGLEDQLNQFTQQLLPDTVGFEVPKSMPSLRGNGENGSQKASFKQSNDFANKPQVSSFSSSGLDLKKGPSPTKLSSSTSPAPQINFNDYNSNDDYAPTDEMEALLDKSWEKTEDIPVLTEKTADMPALTEKTADIPILEKEKTQDIPLKPSSNSTSGISPTKIPNISKPSSSKQDIPKDIPKDIPVKSNFSNNNVSRPLESNFSNNASRPLVGGLSITAAPTGALVEESRRTERVILIILSLIALIGVSILIWVLILRPLGIV